MIPEYLEDAVNSVVPENVSHIGLLCGDLDGNWLIATPEESPYGITATIPRARREPNETPMATLVRCCREKVIRALDTLYPLPSIFITPNSSTFYFAGLNISWQNAPGAVEPYAWCDLWKAEALISASKNQSTRSRDLAVLQGVHSVVVTPMRRLLKMVSCLHDRGFERLRVATYRKGEGSWYCEFLPAPCLLADHGALTDYEQAVRFFEAAQARHPVYGYPLDNIQAVFGWDDAVFDTPEQIADKFLLRYREAAVASWGPDPRYREWYRHALDATEPYGLFYSMVEDENTQFIFMHQALDHLPGPPPVVM